VLVAALEIHVRGPAQLGSEGQNRLVARARIEPDVEDVPLTLEGLSTARRAGESIGEELFERALVPGVGAVGVEHGGGAIDQSGREQRFAAGGAVDGRDGHAPGALP
jgi:hypothetical protein